MEYSFMLPIGDHSQDGHGQCVNYTCLSNKPVEQVREAHWRITLATGVDIHEICNLHGEDSVDMETFEALKKLGFKGGNKEFGNEVLLSIDDMANLWVMLLKIADPELEIEIQEDPPQLSFCGFDDRGRHIDHVGYGLFS